MRHRGEGKGWYRSLPSRPRLARYTRDRRAARTPSPVRDFIWLPAGTSEPWYRERLRQLAVAAATFLSRWR
jgi:hypothetical protein